jgi:hypothetical protein
MTHEPCKRKSTLCVSKFNQCWLVCHVTILATMQITPISCLSWILRPINFYILETIIQDRHFISINNLQKVNELSFSAPASQTLIAENNGTVLTNPKIFSKIFNHCVKVNNLWPVTKQSIHCLRYSVCSSHIILEIYRPPQTLNK